MLPNIWDFIYGIFTFLMEVINSFQELWNWSFEIGDSTISFSSILTTSLLLIMGLILVKKLVPAA